MPTIIIEGKLPEDRKRKVKCRKCSCVFEFTEKEAERVSDQRDGDCLSIPCPFCKDIVTVHAT